MFREKMNIHISYPVITKFDHYFVDVCKCVYLFVCLLDGWLHVSLVFVLLACLAG